MLKKNTADKGRNSHYATLRVCDCNSSWHQPAIDLMENHSGSKHRILSSETNWFSKLLQGELRTSVLNVQFEKLWIGACSVLKAGTRQGTHFHIIICFPAGTRRTAGRPSASCVVVLTSIFLFFSLLHTEMKNQNNTERRLYSPRRTGKVLCPDIHIPFLGPKSWSERPEETSVPCMLQMSAPCLSGSPHGDRRWPEHNLHKLCMTFL